MPRFINHAGGRAIYAVAHPEHCDLAIPPYPAALDKIMHGYGGPWALAGPCVYFSTKRGDLTAETPLKTNAYGNLARRGTQVMTGYLERPTFIIRADGTPVIDFGPNPKDCIIAAEAGPLLLHKGQRTNIKTELARGKIDAVMPDAKRERSAVGIRPSGHVVYVPVFRSGTLADLQDLLVLLGCTEAMAFDGGGSAGAARPGDVEPPMGYWSRHMPAAFVVRKTIASPFDYPNPQEGGTNVIKLMIDPGHGGKDPGATAGSAREADITMDVARKLFDLLKNHNGLAVQMTHGGEGMELKDRTGKANAWGADYFLSIHVNAHTGSAAHGLETYHYAGSLKGERLARAIHKHLAPYFRADRGVKTADFWVLRKTAMPAALVELGFITNPDDYANLQVENYRQKLAEALAAGVLEALGLEGLGPTPPPPPKEPEIDWKARALAAEDELQRLKDAIRALLDLDV